ncbi:MAG: NAD(P)-binding domain-containing protein [Fulvivirga sp.]
MKNYDLIIIGGGQSALACGYFLKRSAINYLILDNQKQCGGAWLHGWESLTLFSPAEYSSLPGWLMPKSENQFPTRDEVINYLCKYEKRYELSIERPVNVLEVKKNRNGFIVITDKNNYQSRAIISATGTWQKPFIPAVPGRDKFKGKQIHSAQYRNPDEYQGQKILIVGEGNSGAQILADISKIAETAWATIEDPEYLPDDVSVASSKYYAERKEEKFDASKYNLGNIVMVPPVKLKNS